MKNRKTLKFVTYILLGTLCFSSVGCETLRKKFTRKKKKSAANKGPIPILEPIDYGRSEFAAIDSYKKAYSLWQVWSKDFYANIDRETNDKNLKYLLSQMVNQLTIMKEQLNKEKAMEFSNVLDEFIGIQEEYNKPRALRRTSVIKNQFRQLDKVVRNDYNPDVAEEFIK